MELLECWIQECAALIAQPGFSVFLKEGGVCYRAIEAY